MAETAVSEAAFSSPFVLRVAVADVVVAAPSCIAGSDLFLMGASHRMRLLQRQKVEVSERRLLLRTITKDANEALPHIKRCHAGHKDLELQPFLLRHTELGFWRVGIQTEASNVIE